MADSSKKPVGFGRETARKLYRMSQQYQFGSMVTGSKALSPGGFLFWEGVLVDNMEPPEDFLTEPVEAEVDLLIFDEEGITEAEEITLKVNTNEDMRMTVFNRDPFQVGLAGEYVSGFWVHGQPRVIWPGRRILYGRADSTIAGESSGTVSLYDIGSDSGINLTDVHNITDVDAESGTRVEVTVDGPGERWILKPLECPAESGS